ncbi:MAG: mercury transporter MerT [Gammaproteobacteria bacterium]|uniref:mercuric transporter MerT family protein n=1 Tax=Limnobacter sp. TaxID=2003368 RepID=UPI001D64AC51|nr:mercuric transporter MerT family protein [Limnobacter sp.]MBU0785133.1 mercury transporter MerT [Gammaproteobacteria bacterium]MBU0849171.1 mercury transporter MerT [Gammaproteobacteria bacterium]MBU1267922.1 mercury transporter MerT [Gammaproteobacteria bacterium]MBU1528323.1 mercury transporter MerT [Gammaproteobacteria bacterium]MBU1781508.1 mercury transporter MerT [Gammaproteobacteria bacterium]
MKPLQNTGTLIASALAAFGASICCLGPLLLLAVGVGGSSSLGMFTALEPYRPVFIAITLGLLALAYYKMFWRKADCESCSRGQKLVFWVIAVLSILMLAVPWFM